MEQTGGGVCCIYFNDNGEFSNKIYGSVIGKKNTA
jgi:hypothetical protein